MTETATTRPKLTKELYEQTCNAVSKSIHLMHELGEAELEKFGYTHNDFGQRLVQAIDYAEESIPYSEYKRIMKEEGIQNDNSPRKS